MHIFSVLEAMTKAITNNFVFPGNGPGDTDKHTKCQSTVGKQMPEFGDYDLRILVQVELLITEISRDMRKPVFEVSDQVRHKPGFTATEDG